MSNNKKNFLSTLHFTVCDNGQCTKYCVINDHKVQVGTSKYTNSCEVLSCKEDMSSEYYSCGVAVDKNRCTLTPDYKYKYPECCKRMRCVENEANSVLEDVETLNVE